MPMRTVTLSDGSAAAIEVRETQVAEAQFMGRKKKEEVAQKALESLGDLGRIALIYADEVYRGAEDLLQEIKPSKLALEFSVGVEGEVGIPFIAAGRANAALVVTLEWER